MKDITTRKKVIASTWVGEYSPSQNVFHISTFPERIKNGVGDWLVIAVGERHIVEQKIETLKYVRDRFNSLTLWSAVSDYMMAAMPDHLELIKEYHELAKEELSNTLYKN